MIYLYREEQTVPSFWEIQRPRVPGEFEILLLTPAVPVYRETASSCQWSKPLSVGICVLSASLLSDGPPLLPSQPLLYYSCSTVFQQFLVYASFLYNRVAWQFFRLRSWIRSISYFFLRVFCCICWSSKLMWFRRRRQGLLYNRLSTPTLVL